MPVWRSRSEEAVDDFDDYDPTPYSGGYDQSLTYGRPIPPSDEICYSVSAAGDIDYERPNYSSGSHTSVYEAPGADFGDRYGRSRPKPQSQPYSGYGGDGATGEGYGLRPQPQEYGSGYGGLPQPQEYGSEHGSGYGGQPQPQEYGSEYGSGYGGRPQPQEYGSGYGGGRPKKDEEDEGYRRKSQHGYGYDQEEKKRYGEEGYGVSSYQRNEEEGYGKQSYGGGEYRRNEKEGYERQGYGGGEYRRSEEEGYGGGGQGYGGGEYRRSEEEGYGGGGDGYRRNDESEYGGRSGYERPSCGSGDEEGSGRYRKPGYGEEESGRYKKSGYVDEEESDGYRKPSLPSRYGGEEGEEYERSKHAVCSQDGNFKYGNDSDEENKHSYKKHQDRRNYNED